MQDGYMGFSKLADQYGFLLVAPDGNREPGGYENRFWNASDACCDFFSTEVDDSAYVADIIKEVKAQFTVDNNRIYLVGHSNGGFMSYRAAYEHSNTIAAIASLAGATHIEERDAPSEPCSCATDSRHGRRNDRLRGLAHTAKLLPLCA